MKQASGWSLAPDLIASARRLSAALAEFARGLEAAMSADFSSLPSSRPMSAAVIDPDIITERESRWNDLVYLRLQFDGKLLKRTLFATEHHLNPNEFSRWFSRKGRGIRADSLPDKAIRREVEKESVRLRRELLAINHGSITIPMPALTNDRNIET
jgi:hypothetical protein